MRLSPRSAVLTPFSPSAVSGPPFSARGSLSDPARGSLPDPPQSPSPDETLDSPTATSSNDFERPTGTKDITVDPIFSPLSIQDGTSSMQPVNAIGQEPKIGMEFNDDVAAYDFYNKYAFRIGFSIRKELIRKNKKKNIVYMRTYTCSKAGTYKKKSSSNENPKHEELNWRTNCEAHMRINLCKNGLYKVMSFEAKHNHAPVSPSKKKMLRSHKRMNDSEKAIADVADAAGLKPKQTYDFLAKQAGGRKNLSFLPSDYKNYLRSKRTKAMQSGDAGAIMQYLQSRVKEDPAFYYAMQVDEDDQITNIFWADGRSLLDYDCFGDVICFDSTYKTNEYGRPFAPFVGVNHHKQTVVFGAALLYDEKIESFEWVFQTFTHAVGGKAPKVVLTDQDAAMAKAITNQIWN